jgi:uncharacterized Zn finger protein (UPF0148 family)
MVHRNTETAHVCPVCGTELAREGGALRCESHGMFFAYGPQLLVRVPRNTGRSSEPLLPWESRKQLQGVLRR